MYPVYIVQFLRYINYKRLSAMFNINHANAEYFQFINEVDSYLRNYKTFLRSKKYIVKRYRKPRFLFAFLDYRHHWPMLSDCISLPLSSLFLFSASLFAFFPRDFFLVKLFCPANCSGFKTFLARTRQRQKHGMEEISAEIFNMTRLYRNFYHPFSTLNGSFLIVPCRFDFYFPLLRRIFIKPCSY